MESLNFSSDLGGKLIVILQRLADSSLKVTDDVLLEKLLSAVRNEFSKSTKINNLDELINWFKSTLEVWADNPPPVNVLAFVIQLLGIFSGNEEIFKHMYSSLPYTPVYHIKDHINKNMNLKLAYIHLLSNTVDHKSGCQWIVYTKLWREVVDLLLSKSGLFIEREAISTLVKLLKNTDWEIDLLKEVLGAILEPLQIYRNEYQMGSGGENNPQLWKNKLEHISVSVLHAYSVIVETWVTSDIEKPNTAILKSEENELFWRSLVETSDSESLLEKVSIALTLHTLCTNYDLTNLAKAKEIPGRIFEIFKVLVKRKKISTVIKLAKYCQIFWNKVSSNNISETGDLESHFIIIQINPAFILLKKPKHEDAVFETFVSKICDLANENTIRLCYLIRDVVKYGEDEDVADYAFMGISSVSKNMETLNLNRAVLIFQSLAYILKMFTPGCCSFDEPITEEEMIKEQMLCRTREGLLSSILCALCTLIEKFKINWTEALESLCLLKLSSMLLSNPNLSPRLGVQTLSLIKLAISNFMAPNLVLLINDVKGTSFDYLLKNLYNKLHDQNWEVRDSCVEVIGIIAELSDSKYPAFQKMLLEGKYCELILSMSEGDAESYVRSSALRALSEMIRIESIRNQCLNNVDLISKISNIIRNESEGIVRREAALLAKELYESQSYRSNSLTSLYHTMGYAAVNDLHWEVKVNALFFWEKVIQKQFTDQGMIDGFFPSITFSKDNKKIVSLTADEIKLRLRKVLAELSNIGCLYVLITTLKDDYDFKVVQKSAQILTDLIEILKRYDLLEKQSVAPPSDKCSVKRKTSHEGSPEKKIVHTFPVGGIEEDEITKSNRIIQDIVNEFDVSLLENVYNPNRTINPSEIDNFSLKEIKPELFLNEIQNININSFLNAKRKWLLSREDDLNELLSDMLTLSVECETNILDCY
ncbi:UNVERIFIED_CONTAM: hypothetical protein PYX00_000864 [Menopon gallinae]|uniref:BRCA1-associated ATM activator 1 n=1 Tax=Menopon gallinae TaxID=328185 RepID=A0AAW2IBX9_9NEOP